MRELIEAIAAAWDDAGMSTALYYGTLPEKATLPACTFNIVSNTPMHGGMTTQPEGTLVQFSAFSDADGVAEVMDLHDEIRAAFDDVTLDMEGAGLIRGDWVNTVGPVADPDGGWNVHIDYRFLWESTT